MRLSLRSYPHPVVGNRDDVPGAAFDAALEMTTDKHNVYIDVAVSQTSSTIGQLLESGSASCLLHVECSNTLFRRAFEFAPPAYRAVIPAENLNGAVEVNAFVRASKNVSGYRVAKAHTDYGDASFEVRKGDIVAAAAGHVFVIDSSFDALSRIGSIMEIHQATADGDLPMRAEFGQDKILVFLSKKDFEEYKILRGQDGGTGALTTAIVLPVLVEALHVLKEDDDDQDYRWKRALKRRMDLLGVGKAPDCLEVAQRLLELPVKRALASSRALFDGAQH